MCWCIDVGVVYGVLFSDGVCFICVWGLFWRDFGPKLPMRDFSTTLEGDGLRCT